MRNCVGPSPLITGHRRGVVVGNVVSPDEEVAVGRHVQVGEVNAAGSETGKTLQRELTAIARDAVENHPVHVDVLRHPKPRAALCERNGACIGEHELVDSVPLLVEAPQGPVRATLQRRHGVNVLGGVQRVKEHVHGHIVEAVVTQLVVVVTVGGGP